jgi:hypothetical protein
MRNQLANLMVASAPGSLNARSRDSVERVDSPDFGGCGWSFFVSYLIWIVPLCVALFTRSENRAMRC